MKKTVAVLLATCFLIVMAVGCSSGNKPENTATPTPSAALTQGVPSADANGTVAPAQFYENYLNTKMAAIERVSDKIEDDDTLAMSMGMALFAVSAVDMYLLPLTIIGLEEESGGMALAFLGMEGVEIQHNGNSYSIAYTDEEGGSFVMTCDYDPLTDSMQSTVTEGTDTETMFFEYVKTGDGYASQYYMLEDDGSYELIKSYFNDTNLIACGFITTDEQPASIYKNSNLDKNFVVNDELYIMLEDDVLTVCEDGETNTF